MKTSHSFDRDYYEHGIEKRISGYQNYSYIPQRAFEEAQSIMDEFHFSFMEEDEKILDFGCAKGFLVHALRQLGYDAYGYDISEYAIKNSHKRVRKYVSTKFPEGKKFGLVICKDVLEHVPKDELQDVLKKIRGITRWNVLVVVPLGDNGRFRIREYELDATHVIKENEDWWIDQFRKAGFTISSVRYSMRNLKKKWQPYEYGNGFFRLGVKDE